MAVGNGAAITEDVMNSLSLIRTHMKKAERLHKAQLISTTRGSKYDDQTALNANHFSRKQKAKRLHNAQLMAF